MSKLYWMSQMIATDSGENITFAPSTTSGLTSTKVSAAIREVATNMTGIIMSKELPAILNHWHVSFFLSQIHYLMMICM